MARVGKRANREGSVYQLADGRWRGGLTHEGRRHYTPRCSTQAEAVRLLDELKVKRGKGAPLGGGKMKLAAWLDHWLDAYVKGKRKPRTYDSYESHIRTHLVPALGHYWISDIRPAHIRNLYRRLEEEGGLSPNTVRRIATTLNRALKDAVTEEVIERSPALTVSPPSAVKHLVDPPTPEEVARLRAEAEGHRMWEAFIALAVSTGLRHGELLALTWTNLKLDNRDDASVQVLVTQRRVKGKGVQAEATKTTHSRAVLPIPPTVVDILVNHRKRQIAERLAASQWQDHDLVYCSRKGTPVDVTNNVHRWHVLRERAGVRPMRVHDLRHAFVTYLLALGESMKVVQELARHGSIHVTMDTYAHVMPAAKRDAAAKMDRFLSGETSIG